LKKLLKKLSRRRFLAISFLILFLFLPYFLPSFFFFQKVFFLFSSSRLNFYFYFIFVLLQIPSLNEQNFESIPNGTLVRFRGMVQNMFEPEYFPAVFEVSKQGISKMVKICLFFSFLFFSFF